MKYKSGNADELKHKFWNALADSPFVFVALENMPGEAVPMTAQLDKDADSAIWFFTSKGSHLAQLGSAHCIFTGKGHDLFAHFNGTLSIESSRERLDKQWSNFVEAWFPRGKSDPNLLMLRMDLGEAEIWSGDLSLLTTAKMALGMDVRQDATDKHTETTL
ncbi:pyridoxamine 5'-phosphate oxidase family protein [Altererythrobacter sp. N1]|uniref:General stress protein n=2 Tax=Tsuneonella suprasediminis TaxID=2306996 RepID=A0A419R1B5_9SPHN|nr:pyridoxamine 5'-phosphate oxidase family protein [Tsuneonella suprasediminis]RJX67075.1 general stress protein [Tsuneonella suprasediminis]UBS34720.1 pyridoxamine 5'-phosphate oxidase family protein [Altererythrobacter sp. N1]